MYMNCSKSFRPRPRGGSYDAPTDLLVARGFLPSAIAASRLWRLQFPHGLKFNSIKDRWPMRLGGGKLRQWSWGDRRPWWVLHAIFFCGRPRGADLYPPSASTLSLRLDVIIGWRLKPTSIPGPRLWSRV